MIYIACCGDDCNYCPRYIGTINNDVDALKKAAEIWYKIGLRNKILSPDEMKCSGCSSVKWCKYGIKECCEKKQIANCGYCAEIPCKKLKEMFKGTKKYKKISKTLLAKEEYEMLNTAFWMKEKYLKRIQNERKMNDNKTPYKPSDYDSNVRKTIPYYEFFHEETINLIKTINPNVKKWLDTGCGTGFLTEKALPVFKDCIFILADPSGEMLMRAKKRLQDCKNVEYLDPIETENMKLIRQKEYDVITAIQIHHYLNKEDRMKATENCYKLLKDNGIYVTFENIRPENDEVLDFQLDRWMNFQLLEGRNKRAVAEHRKRFGVKYFPIRVSEHLELLNSVGFRTVEIFWISYLQAGFFCIK